MTRNCRGFIHSALLAVGATVLCTAPTWADPITDGLVLWLDASDPSSIFSDEAMTTPAGFGDPVAVWADKSGNGYNAVQTNALRRPSYLEDAIYRADSGDYAPALRFDTNGGNHPFFGPRAEDGMLIDDTLNVQAPYTAFIVNQYWGVRNGRTLQSGSGANWLLGLWGGRTAHYAEGWVSQNDAALVGANLNEVYVNWASNDTSFSQFSINGDDLSYVLDNAPTGAPGPLALNGVGQFAEWSDSDVAEVIVYDRALSTSEINEVYDYLHTKYEDQPYLGPNPPPTANVVNFGSLTTFTGGDPGDGIDTEGTFQYAVNVGGPGGSVVNDAVFTNDSTPGFTVVADQIANPWGASADYGDTPADNGLETVMNSIRWATGAGGGQNTVDIQLENLIAGADYKLQLLFAERCCDRAYDVLIDGEEAVGSLHVPILVGGVDTPNTNDVTQGAVFTYEFVSDGSNMIVQLDGRRGGYPDVNALIQGLTLELSLDLPGDFNMDGSIDLADAQILTNGVGRGTSYSEGDLNLDGVVDLYDFREFKAAFAGAAAVPEPSTLWLTFAACGGLAAFRRRRLIGRFLAGLAVVAGLLFAAAPATAQDQFTANWVVDGEGDWNVDANWLLSDGTNFVPFPGDFAVIGNGGTAVVASGNGDSNTLTINNGAVDVRNGGTLQVINDDFYATPGGSATVGPAGALRVSGSGEAIVDINMVNNGLFKLSGPNSSASVGGNFTNNGRFAAGISAGNHGLLSVTGTANLGGSLLVQIDGVTPSAGDSWDLISAGSISGDFAVVDASQSPPLPRGLQYSTSNDGSVYSLSVDNALILTLDRTTGAASISNAIGSAIDLDGYTIGSANGLLNAGEWATLAAGGAAGDGWVPATNADDSVVTELNFTGSYSVDVGADSMSLGNLYAAGPIGPSDEDVTFAYTSTDGEVRNGIVEYIGAINDIVLAVDPDTGAAQIRNLSPYSQFAAAIDGYAITSASGALDPSGWEGLEDSGAAGDGWRKGTSPTAGGIAELNLDGSTMVGEGTVLPLGEIFTPGALRDLVFQYAAIGGEALPGDTNDDGVVDLVDFNNLKTNFGSSGGVAQGDFDGNGIVDLLDFNILKANFGATGGGGGGDPEIRFGTVVFESLGSGAAAVPEPGSLGLAALAGIGGLLMLRGRSSKHLMQGTRKMMRFGIVAVAVSALNTGFAFAQVDNDPIFGEVGVFTGGDPGEGLDLEGTFQYAVNARGPGGLQAGDALFTADNATPGFSIQADNEILNWGGGANYGDSDADNALETVMNSIRWTGRPGGVVIDMDSLVVGANYKLQLLFAERCCDRAWAITINDELAITDFFANGLQGGTSVLENGAVYSHEFIADSTSLHIDLNGTDTLHADGNAIFNGLTLEISLDLPGDFDFDGSIDLNDYDILLDNILTGDNYAEGDINFSGAVDLQDFVEFKQAYHAAAAAVPEPSALALLLACGGALVWSRRRR